MVLTPIDSVPLDFQFAKEVRDSSIKGEVQALFYLNHVLEEETNRQSPIRGSQVHGEEE